MKNYDIKGFLIGALLAIIGFLIIVVISTSLKMYLIGTVEGAYTTSEQIFLSVLLAPINLWAGYIIARVSKRKKLINALIYAVFSSASSFFLIDEMSMWYIWLSAIAAIPLTYLGAMLHINKANKAFNSPSAETAESAAR